MNISCALEDIAAAKLLHQITENEPKMNSRKTVSLTITVESGKGELMRGMAIMWENPPSSLRSIRFENSYNLIAVNGFALYNATAFFNLT